MNAEQKAIIDAANNEGVPACERDARLVVYSMMKATRKAMAKYEVGLNKMTEKQQDAVHGDLEAEYKELALSIARAMASAGTPSIIMDCKDLKIANGTFTGIVKSDQKHFNDLISKVQDKSEVVVVLYERQYADALDGIESDKDQRSLGLDVEDRQAKAAKAEKGARVSSPTSAATLAKKATELPPKLLEDARSFITNQQVCTVSGIQNGLKIGAVKATAVLDQMVVEGLVEFIGDSKSGEYKLAREKSPVDKIIEELPDAADKMISDLTFDGDQSDLKAEPGDEQPASQVLTDELYEKVKAQVLKTKKVSIGALSITFSLDDEIVEQAVDRLELEGVITEENEMGVRSLVAAE